jgi:hypothetical protein
MGIEWLRDLVIIIWGFLAIAVLLAIAILGFVLYRKIKSLMDSIKSTSERGKEIISTVEEAASSIRTTVTDVGEDMVKQVREGVDSIVMEMVRPVVQIVAVVHGIRQGMTVISGLFTQNQGGNNE